MLPPKVATSLKTIVPSASVLKGATTRNHYKKHNVLTTASSLFPSSQQQEPRRGNDESHRQFQRDYLAKIALPFSTLPNTGYNLIENGQQEIKEHVSILSSNRDRPYFDRSVPDLLQSLFVFELCHLKILVRHGEKILYHARSILGRRITDFLIRNTFFKQFCGGENHIEVSGKVTALNNVGVGVILDYAVEDDNTSIDHHGDPEQYDKRLSKFLQCIELSRDSPNYRKFVAVKLTSLGSSSLLQCMSSFANDAQRVFVSLDKECKGYLTRDEFSQACQDISIPSVDILKVIQALDPHDMNAIDHIDFCSAAFGISSSWASTGGDNSIIDMFSSSNSLKLSFEELRQIKNMHQRLQILAEQAMASGVCLLIDAEQSWYQPAIDIITIQLQQRYNRFNNANYPIVFNTYQCYLLDASERVKMHFRRSQRQEYYFGSKVVRGAYMQGENKRAEKYMYPSPIHCSIEDTHKCYNEVLDYLMQCMNSNSMEEATLEVMCATHNHESIEYVIGMMDKLGLSKSNQDKIYFAQLYGMSDDLTIPLGKMGYCVYKYLPYGEIQEVIPYMLRRAQENGDMLRKSNNEKRLIMNELKARCKIM